MSSAIIVKGHRVETGADSPLQREYVPYQLNQSGPLRADLFAHHLHYQCSRSRAVVKIDKDDLLPRSQGHLPFDEGYGERRSEQGMSSVCVAIAIAPAQIMAILQVGRGDAIEQLLDVVDGSRFVLGGCQATGGAWCEQGDNTALETRSP